MMNAIQIAIRYCYRDFQLTWREPSTRLFLFMPLAFLALLHFAIPPLLSHYPVAEPWTALFLDGLVFQGALMFSFVSGFLLLDEKDQDLITVYRVAPLGLGRLLVLKMANPFLLSLSYVSVALATNPFLHLSISQWMIASLHFSLLTPLIALFIGAMAKNKVEGLTWFKLVDLILIAPFLGFFLPQPWDKIFFLFPTHWAFDSLQALYNHESGQFWLDQSIGIAFIVLLLMLSAKLFQRRVT